jgi:hypothetical protein
MRRWIEVATVFAAVFVALPAASQGLGQPSTSRSAQAEQSTQARSWITFNSSEGGFTVLLPRKPELFAETFSHPRFKGPAKSHRFVAFDNRRMYAIAYSEYPPEYQADPGFELNNSQKTVLDKLKAQLSSSRPTQVERGEGGPPLPAEEFTATDRNNLEYQVLTVFDGKRPIQLLAGIPKSEKRPAEDDVRKFFASFQLQTPKQ